MVEGVANQSHDFRLKRSELYLLDLEKIADKVSLPGDLIGITGGLNPEEMYFAHRSGWGLGPQQFKDTAYLSKIRDLGCRYLFVNKREAISPLEYPVVYNDLNYIIYRFE